MQKETVIAKVRAELSFSDKGKDYMRGLQGSWLSESNGDMFLREFGGHWNGIFTEYGQDLFQDYFKEMGLNSERLPQFRVVDSHRGSWVMEAALTMFGSIGSVYVVLKSISDLPKIADGLEELKSRLSKELGSKFEESIRDRIEPSLGNIDTFEQLPPPPKHLTISSFSIDARPLRNLTPDKLLNHKIHLSAGISRSAFVLENLGDDDIRDLNIGLFKSATQRHQWSIEDAFSKTISLLSAKQSTSVSVQEFKDRYGKELEITDATPVYLDCWCPYDTSA